MRLNNLLKVIGYYMSDVSKKWRRRCLNLRPTDPETDTLTAQPPRLACRLPHLTFFIKKLAGFGRTQHMESPILVQASIMLNCSKHRRDL